MGESRPATLVDTFAALLLSVLLSAAQTRPDIPNNPFTDSASAIDTGRAIFAVAAAPAMAKAAQAVAAPRSTPATACAIKPCSG
jgi:hypothetical protein